MKKGDIVAKTEILPVGSPILHNPSSQESAMHFLETTFYKQYGCKPAVEIKVDETTGKEALCLREEVRIEHRAKVQWVVGDEAALGFEDGGYRIINIKEEPDWTVVVEGVPSYQSSVEHMSDEDLVAAVEQLRMQRTINTQVKVKKERTPTVSKNDPLALALSGMSEEKKKELMKKLGMIDT